MDKRFRTKRTNEWSLQSVQPLVLIPVLRFAEFLRTERTRMPITRKRNFTHSMHHIDVLLEIRLIRKCLFVAFTTFVWILSRMHLAEMGQELLAGTERRVRRTNGTLQHIDENLAHFRMIAAIVNFQRSLFHETQFACGTTKASSHCIWFILDRK